MVYSFQQLSIHFGDGPERSIIARGRKVPRREATIMITPAYREPTIDFSTFPATDGLPMAETELNQDQMIDLILQLEQPLVPLGHHVEGNLLRYWNPEDGWQHIAPDVFVALDSGPARRESWKTWVEGKFPEVVFEIASPSTRARDIQEKVALYEERGVAEILSMQRPSGIW